MGSFVVTLIGVAILNGVIGMISPEGDIRKYVRLIGSLCIISAILSPFVSLLSEGIPDFDISFGEGEYGQKYEDIYESALAEGGKSAAEKAVKSEISRRFSLSEEAFDVKLIIDDGGEKITVSSVNVYLGSSFINADPKEIADFVSERLGYSCEVIYDLD